jgi:intein/homing endonuclease
MKAVSLLINSFLPPELRDDSRSFDKKSIDKLLADVALKYPDQYSSIVKQISDVGRKAAYLQGESLGLSDFTPPFDKEAVYAEMDKELKQANKIKNPDERKNAKMEIWSRYATDLEKMTIDSALATGNRLGNTVVSGARGNPFQLKAMVTTPALYTDYKDNPIPLFVRRSFGEGLRPYEYLASTFGVRKSILCLKHDTRVRMADGTEKEISKILPGEFVIGADVRGGTFPVMVKNVFDNGVQPVFRHTFKMFNTLRVLESTKSHKILCSHTRDYQKHHSRKHRDPGYTMPDLNYHAISVEAIENGGLRFGAVLPCGFDSGGQDEPLALLMGLLTGDGCLTHKNNRVSFSCADRSLIEDISHYLDRFNLQLRKNDTKKLRNFCWALTKKNYSAEQNLSIQKGHQGFKAGQIDTWRQKLLNEGLLGKYAHEKECPRSIDTWSNEAVAQYLAGIIATDGSLYYRDNGLRVTIAMTSEKLVRKLQQLLEWRFGIYSTQVSCTLKGGFGTSQMPRKHPLYSFSITRFFNVEKLLPIFKFVPGVKRKKFDNLLTKVRQLQCSPYPKALLRKQEFIGYHHCFDLEVDHPDHLFVTASGIIVSNSTKNATADAGDLSKQLVQAAAPLVVTDDDCGTANGLDYDPDDSDLMGRVLARDAAGVEAGTPIDKQVLNKLRRSNKKVLIRSPMTCQAKEGICSKCLGLLPEGRFAPKGYMAGVTAASALGEPLTQGSLNCLREGTRVRMADGSIREIENIRIGEWVLGADLKGNTFPTLVTGKWDQGIQTVYRYSYRLGNTRQIITLESTEEHPVLCNRKTYGLRPGLNNRKIEKLKAGYPHKELAVVLPTDSQWQGRKEPLALLVGIYLGDGIRNSGGHEELRFSCADEMLIKDLTQHSVNLNLKFTKRRRSFDWGITVIRDLVVQHAKTGRMLNGFRNPLKAKLKELGILGKYAHEKTIPAEVWSWTRESVAELIAGFIATDGSVYKNKDGHVGISFTSTSRAMLQEIKDLLAVRLCIYGSEISQIGEAGTGNRTHDVWSFYVTRYDQVERLHSLLHIPGVKGPRLTEYLKTANYLKRNTEGFYRAKRVSIAPLGPQQCWDLTVAHQDSLFVLANGIICSNTKHSGGGFGGNKKEFSGFNVIDQLMQSPETFPFRAAVSEKDGKVEAVEDAPQGGKFIRIGGVNHYALPGYEVTVKTGDVVEAGDTLSEGVADVADILKHRGLGEARRYYVDRVRQAFEESGAGRPSKLNLELMARAALDHVRVDHPDGLGDYLVDDLGSYNRISHHYSPPATTRFASLREAPGKFLQAPTLHYTIGTRITPKMIKRLEDVGIRSVAVSDEEPPFKPEMVRLRATMHSGTDWLAKQHSSYLTSNLQADAARARDTNLAENVHFAPRLAVGEGFGEKIKQTGKF